MFVWPLCGALALLLVLWMLGFVGSRREAANMNYRAAVGAQEPRKILVIDGVNIAYTDSGGDGSTIVCLHAIGHGSRDFEDLSRRLAPQYRVLAFDFPSQGNSGHDRQEASGTRYEELLSEFVDRVNLTSFALLGNSIGGAAAIRYAELHPDRVTALVLCDSGGLGAPNAISQVFIFGFVQFFAAGRRGAFWFPWAFEKYYSRVLVSEPAHEERRRIVRSAYEIAPTLEQAWRSFARPEENVLPNVQKLKCPVFLAWAKYDFVLPLKAAEPAFSRFPRHILEVFDGGHAPFLEDPEHFERSLRGFLHSMHDSPLPEPAG